MTNDIFKHNMLRSYNEQVFYNIFKTEDQTELNNVIKFAEGLVIKNKEMADMYETSQSQFAANTYINAIDEDAMRRPITELERQSVIKNFKESNGYYLALKLNYGVNPYDARKAKNYHILKSMNTTLGVRDQDTFYRCYYEMLTYFNKVTNTDAFNNQNLHHEFYTNYIIFGTILRYIGERMDDYFDVDTYGAKELKNGFISWGSDYFDEIPVIYQRRIFKRLNDLIRNKGTDNVLKIISDLFSFQNIDINRYLLSKIVMDTGSTNPTEELVMYRVPFDEKLDTGKHEQLDINTITSEDPYWRSTDNEILGMEFNTIPTKYISTDVKLDISSNSKEMSYFISLLHEAELIDRSIINDYVSTGQLSGKDAKEKYGILDSDFYFMDNEVSPAPISVVNAIATINLLILRTLNLPDRTINNNSVEQTHAYNFEQTNVSDLKDIRGHLYWYKTNFPLSLWKEYMRFFSSFRLKTVSRYEQIDIDTIIDEFDTNIRYYNQLLYVGDLIEHSNKSTTVSDYVKTGSIYDAIELTTNMLMDPSRNVPLSILFKYVDLHSLLSKFVDYQVDTGMMSKDKLMNGFKGRVVLRKELEELKTRVNDYEMSKIIDGYLTLTNPTLGQVESFINRMMEYFYKYPETERQHLRFTQNLYVYFTIFTTSVDFNRSNSKFSIRELIDVYYYNETVRKKLETYMESEEDPVLYSKMKLLWDRNFKNAVNADLYREYDTLTDYLMTNDPNLYNYSQVSLAVYDFENSKKPLYRERLFKLVESLDIHLNMKEDMFARSNFVGMNQYIKRYVRILLEVFKAFSLQVLDTNTSYIFGDRTENGIKLRDSMTMTGISLHMTDDLQLHDVSRISHTIETIDDLALSETVTLTINDDGVITTVTI